MTMEVKSTDLAPCKKCNRDNPMIFEDLSKRKQIIKWYVTCGICYNSTKKFLELSDAADAWGWAIKEETDNE
jgi:hypothetical protein